MNSSEDLLLAANSQMQVILDSNDNSSQACNLVINKRKSTEVPLNMGHQAIITTSGVTRNLQDAKNVLMIDTYKQKKVNFKKPDIPSINVPEKIILCLDTCFDDELNSLFLLGDGTSISAMNMMKRVVEFFLYTKLAINKRTQFALILLRNSEVWWAQDFTNDLRELIIAVNEATIDQCLSDHFDFSKVFQVLKNNVDLPQCKIDSANLPPYIIRMIVLYGRSKCIPVLSLEDPYIEFIKFHNFFYIDILLAHEEDCALNKCEQIYDALQDLDNGYSYVFEVSKNATKIHDNMAKLLAHPLQRALQKNTNYSFRRYS